MNLSHFCKTIFAFGLLAVFVLPGFVSAQTSIGSKKEPIDVSIQLEKQKKQQPSITKKKKTSLSEKKKNNLEKIQANIAKRLEKIYGKNSLVQSIVGIPASADSAPRIAGWGGKVNQHINLSTGQWETDPDGSSGDELIGLDYCKKWYPGTIGYRSYSTELITTWQNRGNTGGPFPNTVQTYECVQPASVGRTSGGDSGFSTTGVTEASPVRVTLTVDTLTQNPGTTLPNGTMYEGQKAVLEWLTYETASSCTTNINPAYTTNSGIDWNISPVIGTHTYTVTCKNSTGATGSVKGVLTVLPKPTSVQKIASVSVDLKVNGSDGPISVSYLSNLKAEWKSDGAEYCTASGTPAPTADRVKMWTSFTNPTGEIPKTGSINLLSAQSFGFNPADPQYISQVVLVVSCAGSSGTAEDRVVVNISKPVDGLDATPRIAYWPGKTNQHVTANGEWSTDKIYTGASSMLDKGVYCNLKYPGLNAWEPYKMETITTWQSAGNNDGPYTNTVQTYKCIKKVTNTDINTVGEAVLLGTGDKVLDKNWARLCSDGKPHIQVLSPNGGEVYQYDDILNIRWKTCNIPASGKIQQGIGYFDPGEDEQSAGTGVCLNVDSEITHTCLSPQNTGNARLSLKAGEYLSKLARNRGILIEDIHGKNFQYQLCFNAEDGNPLCGAYDVSDTLFTIQKSGTPNVRTVTDQVMAKKQQSAIDANFNPESYDIDLGPNDAIGRGETGENVCLLQELIKAIGFGRGITPSSPCTYGPRTVRAVSKFQKSYNLPRTGVVDIDTLDVMLDLIDETDTLQKKSLLNR
jgi:hypothetical protein